jgi:hypothetical protein
MGGRPHRQRRANRASLRCEWWGLHKDETSYQLLEQWLVNPPPLDMLAKWKDNIQALSATLSDEARLSLKSSILHRAREIASVTGGILGVGSKVSKAEKAVLDDLARSFLQECRQRGKSR